MNILILSDFVGCGNVAMGVARSVLTHMGHNALCLPTALISNTWNLGAPAVLDTTAYLQEAIAADLPDIPSIFISSVSGYHIRQLKDMLWEALQRDNQ